MQDSAGGQYDFTYNGNGQLETFTYPVPQDGVERPLWSFNYTADGLLEYITDPNLKINKTVYNDGKVIRIVAPEGVIDISGNETVNAADYSKEYGYDTTASVSKYSGTILATTPQTTITETDGGQWLYFYDREEGVLLGKQDPLGNLTEYGWYNSSSPYYGQREYILTPLEQTGNEVSYRMTTYNSYDAAGNPLDIATNIRTITYDDDGNQTNTEDTPVYRHLTYTYGTFNRPTSITDVVAATTTTINYANQGDGSEIVTLTAPKINSSDSTAPQTIISYRTDGQIGSITDPLGRIVTYSYDASGILTSVTDLNNIVSSFSNFDGFGLAQNVTLTGNDGSTTRTTSLSYNNLAQLIQVTQGSTTPLLTEFDYDGIGNRISAVDAEQNETSFEYDSSGHTIKISNILDPGETEERSVDTLLSYGGSGCPSCSGSSNKLTALTDAKGQTTLFNYDLLGRLTQETDAELNSLSYTYYADGRPKQKFLGEPDTGTLLLTYEYTVAGKLEFKKDAANNTLASYSYYVDGRLQSATTPDSSYSLSYYDNGWLKSVDNGTYIIEYQYDNIGRRELVEIKQSDTVLQSIDYIYDATTQELTDIVSDQVGTFTFGYDAFGRRSSLNFPNGVVGSYSYDAANNMDWLTDITFTDGVGGSNILSVSYPQHDKVGNRMQRSEDGTTTSYSYDDLYRVTNATTGLSAENFTYDDVGNRESGPTVKDTADVSYEHNAANQMLKGRKFSYDYDDQGNQTHRYLNATKTKYWQYHWTVENQLQQAQLIKNGQTIRTVNVKYDAFGRRIEKQVTQNAITTTTSYIYDGEDIVLQLENDGTDTIITHYLHGPGIDEPLAQSTNGQTYCYHADGLGSIVAMTNSSKNIVQRYSYDTYGMLTGILNHELTNSYTYTGREWDRELGLYYYRARYYDPMEGRFIGKDPIGFAGGDVNLYGYVGNQPVDWIDPWGLISDEGQYLEDIVKQMMPWLYNIFKKIEYESTVGNLSVLESKRDELIEKEDQCRDRADMYFNLSEVISYGVPPGDPVTGHPWVDLAITSGVPAYLDYVIVPKNKIKADMYRDKKNNLVKKINETRTALEY